MVKIMKSKSKKSKSIISLVLLLAIILLFIIFIIKSNSREFIQVSDHDLVIGRENAPVTIVMFSRYECSVSKKFFDEMYPQLKEKYIDTGKVRFIYKHFYSPATKEVISAQASLCANDQGMFWPYHALLFERVKEWSERSDTTGIDELFNPIFSQYAVELGLDEETFLNCLYQNLYKAELEKDYAYALEELGLGPSSGTPIFLINGLKIEGLPSLFEDFESILLKFRYS